MSKKTTKAEKMKRVNIVYELLVDGASRAEIINYSQDVEVMWDVSDRTIDNYVAAATELLKAGSEANREAELSKSVRRLVKLYRKAHKVNDYKTCLAIQMELNKLQGLYPSQEIGINKDGTGQITGFTIEVISQKDTADQTDPEMKNLLTGKKGG